MTREEILRTIASHTNELRGMGVRSLSLFGSVARGEEGPDSDVDLLVELERPAGYFKLVSVAQRLEEILGQRVDLVPRKALRPEIEARVLAEAIRAA
ncbi:MAG: nucleotidyltransferase family protein [Deltaproteobacteria bacterium]|nr:nucleotidyltransferase family protein [Deltaproteobacteria bacterium]MBW2254423.1 nucleotidyltransferase family protein [Deltaproteobacteria bacterium]